MSYVVNFSSTGQPGGKPAITVPDQSYDIASTSLTLTGFGLHNYGLFQQENFVWLLENFASANAPSTPTVGQLWYNTTSKVLGLWDGNQWLPSGGAISSDTAPANPTNGMLWYDTVNHALKYWDSNIPDWVTIGLHADTADALSIARTITLAGDVTGSTTFDGSGNVTITTTVVGQGGDGSAYARLDGAAFTGDVSFTGSVTRNSKIIPSIDIVSTVPSDPGLTENGHIWLVV